MVVVCFWSFQIARKPEIKMNTRSHGATVMSFGWSCILFSTAVRSTSFLVASAMNGPTTGSDEDENKNAPATERIGTTCKL